MPEILPFVPGNANYRLATTLDGDPYILDVRWNGRDGAWYFDLLEEDETPIVHGLKIVLGGYIGRYVDHLLFKNGVFFAVDTSGQRLPPTLDDLGTRVQVYRFSVDAVWGEDPDAIL